MENGKAKLLPGERSARWYGRTWKSKLYVEDRIAIKKFVITKFVRVLSRIEQYKTKDQAMNEAPPAAPRKNKPSRRLVIWAVPLIAAIVLTAGALYNYSYLNEGYGVLRSDGPKAALEFFQNGGESYDNLFGLAWAAYRVGDYEMAELLSNRVLKSPIAEDQARAWYLLGDLKTIAGKYDDAGEFLLNAQALYESIGKEDSLYRTRLMLVKLYLAKRDFYHSDYYIALAKSFEGSEGDQYFLYLKSQKAFLKHDFEAALAFSLQRIKASKGDRARLTKIFSDVGFYYGLTGDLQKLSIYTNQSNDIAKEQDDEKSLIYNRINICLYMKCSMQDYSEHRTIIMDYARRNKDIKLMEHMYFVDKFTCPLMQTDSGDAPPPGRSDTGDPPPPGSANPSPQADGPKSRLGTEAAQGQEKN